MNFSNLPDLASADDVRQALARRGVPLLLNFTAKWCQPCKTFAPVLAAVAGAHGDLIAIERVDVDACPDLAREFGIRGVPASILLRDGVEQDRLVGTKSQRAFVQWLAARGVPLPVPPEDHAPRVAFGAFHGDESLKRFLVERLYRHMDDGEVPPHIVPSWQAATNRRMDRSRARPCRKWSISPRRKRGEGSSASPRKPSTRRSMPLSDCPSRTGWWRS